MAQQYSTGKPYDILHETMARWEETLLSKLKILDRRAYAHVAATEALIAAKKTRIAVMDAKLGFVDLVKRVETLEQCYFYHPVRFFRNKQAPKRKHRTSRSYRRMQRNKRLGRW